MYRWRSSWKRYALATLVTAPVAGLVALAGSPDANSDPAYFAFTIAILMTAVVAGLGPGLVATGIATFACAYFFLPPISSRLVAPEQESARLILFISEGVIVSLIGNQAYDSFAEDRGIPWFRRYECAAIFVASATVLKLLAWRTVEHEMPFTLYYAAVAAAAWAGGIGSGIASTLMASLCARFFFIDPIYSFRVQSPEAAGRLLLFVGEGITISVLAAMTVRTRHFADRVIDKLRHSSKRRWRGAENARPLRASDAIWEWDFPSILALTGKEGDTTLTAETSFAAWLKQVHPRDRLKVLGSLKVAMEQGLQEWSAEYRRMLPGQGYMHVADRARIVRDDLWNRVRLIGRSTEVPASALRNEETYRAFFDSNPHATLLADGGLHIVDANDAACDVLGYTRDALKRMGLVELIPGSSRGMLLGLCQEDPLEITFEEDCVRGNGEVFRAKISAALVSGAGHSSIDRIITIEEMAEAESRF